VADAARRGELAEEHCVWQPGAERWEQAGDIATLWVLPAEQPTFVRTRRTLLWSAVVALIICGTALLLVLPSLLMGADPDPARSIKKNCAFSDYLKGRCR
jgi:hypothetical protein